MVNEKNSRLFAIAVFLENELNYAVFPGFAKRCRRADGC